ncbi:MAG: HNH endonuclease [Thioploca sp.]|nr:HNH endonuclease [Thioploca sp.]
MAVFDRKDDFLYLRWAREIKQKNHYTCEICGRRGIELNAHHLNAWASFPDERYDISNGTCLCRDHHEMFHDIYGKGENTKEQFEEFRNLIQSLQIEAKYQVQVEEATKYACKLLDVQHIVEKIIEESEKDSD